MKKQQIILVGCGLFLLIILFFFGKTTQPSKNIKAVNTPQATKIIETDSLMMHAKERLTAQQMLYINGLENEVKRGDVKNQQIAIYNKLASFWRDSIHLFEPYAFYTAESAKLVNSEKNLTFAAHLFLDNLKIEAQPSMQQWLATNAKDLFTRSLALNPTNDSSKIGLGACYIFGNLSTNPMEGISLIREVVQRNPDNIFGQMMLGLGGIKSGQYDKALERFKIIESKEPENLEALLNIAEIYDRKGEKAEAVNWYKKVRSKVNNAEAKNELDERIKTLQ